MTKKQHAGVRVKNPKIWRPGQLQASSAAHIAPIHDHCFQDENHCHSGNREKDTAQFKGEQSYHEA